MPARITIERILRDEDDASGQTVREWTIECDPGHIMIKMKHGTGFLHLRPSDVEQLIDDLRRAEVSSTSLAEEEK